MKNTIITCLLAAASLTVSAQTYSHTVQAENLGRGTVAVKAPYGVFVSWRSLVTDDPAMTFDVYRDGTKLNSEPLKVTNFTDAAGTAGATYQVKCHVNGQEVDSHSVVAWNDRYMKVHLDRPAGGTSPAGGSNEQREYVYTPDDVSVGDVDGDGEYELFVKWFPTNQADNSFRRFTGNTIIDCYKLDGTKLWRIDLGINIRSGNHYTQFMVWDFDGDGKAELICKTAPGTVDGTGHKITINGDNPDADYRTQSGSNSGIILSGPEYLTVFNGLTGAEINTIPYNPPRSILSSSAWGDSYGNRCERYLACVAYLDGEKPSAVFCRGYYTAAYVWAVDFDGTKLQERWLHASTTKGQGLYGEGAHSITVGDVDGDGKDEIVYGAASLDHDGSLLYRTGAGHGDALHLAAMIPGREGLQVFMPHEEKSSSYKWDAELRDARTGEILYGNPQSGTDNGRGLAANISAKWPGYEYWSSVTSTAQNCGQQAGSKKPDTNFRIYWDGDLLDELFDGRYNSSGNTAAPRVTKPNNDVSSISTLVTFSSVCPYAYSCNTTKATPNLQADLFGDWREEVILHDGSTESDLIIFSTTIPTEYKVNCLMQDRQYREAIAWQNVAYNQPPHLSYNLEESFSSTGIITVIKGSLEQVVNLGDPIDPLTVEVKRATGLKLVDSPEWLTVDFDAATLTGVVSGKPVADGEFSFTLTTTGAEDDNNTSISGKILVHDGGQLVLMAHFPFDQVGATTPNAVYGEATANGGESTAVPGHNGNALELTGNYYVQPGYEAFDFGDGDFTIEFWMKSTDTAAYLFHKGSLAADAATGNTGHWVGLELKNTMLKFGIDDDVTKTDLSVATAGKVFDGEWHHIVAVRDTYTKKLLMYIDGSLKGEAADVTGAVNCAAENFVIGNVNVNFNNSYEGCLDDLCIYRGAMTATTVLEHYQMSGITDVIADEADAVYTVVDAFSGRIMVQGSNMGVVDRVSGGVYILVVDTPTSRQTYKLRK